MMKYLLKENWTNGVKVDQFSKDWTNPRTSNVYVTSVHIPEERRKITESD